MKLTPEAQKQRDKLEEKIRQANKVEYLYSIDEFNFLMEYLTAWRDRIASTILNGKLLDGGDQRKEDFNKGQYDALNKIIGFKDTFGKAGVDARKALEKFDKAVREVTNDLN